MIVAATDMAGAATNGPAVSTLLREGARGGNRPFPRASYNGRRALVAELVDAQG
jgi:hypothetical protein